jgi:hypothetical protein
MPRLLLPFLAPLLLASLASAATVKGRVLDTSGHPISDGFRLEVRAEGGATVQTDETSVIGTFELSKLAPGRYTIVATSTFGARSIPAEVDLTKGDRSCDVRFGPTASLRVVVEGARSGPWGTQITLFPEGAAPTGGDVVNSGKPRAAHRIDLIAAGTYAVLASGHDGYDLVSGVRLKEGQLTAVTLRPRMASLRVRVVDAARAKLSRPAWLDSTPDYDVTITSQVSALIPKGVEAPFHLGSTLPRLATFTLGSKPGDDTFEATDLAVGPYQVTVSRGDVVLVEAHDVRAGHDVVLTLPKP